MQCGPAKEPGEVCDGGIGIRFSVFGFQFILEWKQLRLKPKKSYEKYPCSLFSPFAAGSYAFAPQTKNKPTSSNQIRIENTGNTITLGQLKAFEWVNAGFGQDFAFNGLKIKVNSYTCVITRKKGDAYFESVRGNLITGTIREQFNKIRPGDIFIITDVNALCEGNKIHVEPLIRTVRYVPS